MTFRWCSNGFTMISNGNGKRNGLQMILIPLRHFWSKPGNGIEMVRNKMAHKWILNGFHLAKGEYGKYFYFSLDLAKGT